MFEHIAKGNNYRPGCRLSLTNSNQVLLTLPTEVAESAGINGTAEIYADGEDRRFKLTPGLGNGTAYKTWQTGRQTHVSCRKPAWLDLSQPIKMGYKLTKTGVILAPA